MKPLPQIPISDVVFWNWVSRNLANFEVVSEIPTVDYLKKGDAVIFESGTKRRLYVNIDGTIYFLGINNANKIIDLDEDTWVEVERTADQDTVWIRTTGFDRIKIDNTGSVHIGDAGTTNYFKIDLTGRISFHGTARINWTKITANAAAIQNADGTSGSTVSDLQVAHDGNTFDVEEVTGVPGIDLIVDFIGVTAINWVNIIAFYAGSAAHSATIQLYNWSTTSWNRFNACELGVVLHDHSFFLPDDSDYIGTDANAGKVRVRFLHEQSGNASHDLYVDVVALYQ